MKSIAISSDSNYIVSGSKDKTIKIWNLKENYGLIHCFPEAHQAIIRSVRITSDIKYIISGSDDESIKIWDFYDKKEI